MPRRNVIEWHLVGKDKLGPAVSSADRKLASLSRRIAIAAAAITAAFAAAAVAVNKFGQAMANASDQISLLEARFDALTGAGTTGLNEVIRISKELGISLETTSGVMTRFALGLQDIGRTNRDLGKLAEVVFKLGRIGGASMREMSAGSLQLAQGLASNRLGGEELRSVMENLPLVFQTMARNIGVSTGKLREMGAEGKLTSDIIAGALLKSAEDVRQTFEDLPFTLAQAKQNVATEWTLLLAAMGRALEASEVFQFFAGTLEAGLRELRLFFGDTTGDLGPEQLKRLTDERAEKLKEIAKLEKEAREAALDPGLSLIKLDEAQQRKERMAELRGEVGQLTSEIGSLDEEIKKAAADMDVLLGDSSAAAGAETGDKNKPSLANFHKVAQDAFDKAEKSAKEWEQFEIDWEQRRANRMREAAEEQQRIVQEQMRVMQTIVDQAARNMQDAFADFLFDPFDDGLDGMVKGFLDAMRRMLANALAAQIFGLTNISGILGSIIPGRAAGGPVSAGRPFIVGERGPELFVPSQNGSIVPGAGMTVNYHIDARGATQELARALPDILERNNQNLLMTISRLNKQGGGML